VTQDCGEAGAAQSLLLATLVRPVREVPRYTARMVSKFDPANVICTQQRQPRNLVEDIHYDIKDEHLCNSARWRICLQQRKPTPPVSPKPYNYRLVSSATGAPHEKSNCPHHRNQPCCPTPIPAPGCGYSP